MAQNIAKGDLALTIDESELEASLRFTPGPGGAEWTADKVLRILMDARIGGFNQKKADDLVQKFSRAKAALTEIVAAGQPPEEPVPETPEWSELVPPPEFAAAAALTDAILAETPPPLLYKTHFETVKVEKTVKKPAALPFLPPKIEKVVVMEKREKREQVFPDTTVLRSGFARKGERIGILSVAKTGKAGKTIFGKPLPASQADLTFHIGPGVLKNKTELLADTDGIIRMGERWVDMVGVPLHRWSVEVSPDGATFFLNYSPGEARLEAPSAEEIHSKALELGAPEDSILDAAAIKAILDAAIASKEPLFSRSLSLDRDARVEVKISADRVAATISIWKGRGKGRPLELSAVSAALKSSGVRGFKAEQLKKDVLEFFKGKGSELLDYPLVEGRAPERGNDRNLSFTLGFLGEDKAREMKARLTAHAGLSQAIPSLDEFPIESATKVAQVLLGQKIGELPPMQNGADGVDIFGTVIPGIPGNDPAVRAFENMEFSKGALTATATGILLCGEAGGASCFRVVRYRDCQIDVSVSPDSLSAFLSLRAEEGLGANLTVEGALAALAAKGVVQGLDPKAIAEAVAEARSGKAVLNRLVARGKPPLAAGGVKVVWIVKRASGALYAMSDHDTVDFHEHDTMTRVSEGDIILKLERAGGAGEPGIDVLGKPIPAPALPSGEKAPEHDESIREESAGDGSTLFVAATGGELVVQGGGVKVRERHAINGDLGPATGNIRFSGAVKVSGNVLAGYSLFAGGDIDVAGAVEAALVSGDGTIRVGEGIKGARKGTIRARKCIEAAFAEQALLLSVDDIRIRNACILCNVKTNGRLLLGSEKGALIGGLCRARRGIDVTALGSENGVKTEVSFGQDFLVADQIEAEEREIEKLKGLILQSDRSMAELERAGAGLEVIRQDKVKLVKLLEKRTLRVFEFREKFEEHVPSEVRVRGTVFPGVILESHNRLFEVRSKRTKVVFTFDPQVGRIVERPL